MNTQLRILVGILLSLGSVIILRVTFPPYHFGLLIGIGFIPMLIAQYRVLPPKVSSLAPALTISGWLGAILIPAFAGKSLGMVILPLGIFLLSLAMDRKKRAFHESTAYRWFVLEGVVGWVGLEMVRGFIPAIGTWAFVGYALWEQPWLIQPLSIFGIYGLDFIIMLLNYGLAVLILQGLCGKRVERKPLISERVSYSWAMATTVLVAGWVVLSLWLYQSRDPSGASVRVAAIQPNLPRAAHRDTSMIAEERLDILADLTQKAAAKGAKIVVWPEMSLGFDPQVEFTGALQSLARETESFLVIGYVLAEGDGFRNEAILISPTGEFLGTYSKTHPMIASGEPKSSGAGEYPLYVTSTGRLGIMICFDASFTDVARRLGRQGVQLIANPSLFGPSIADLAQVMMVFRAVENRSAVVMADVAYSSGIVDPYGRVIASQVTPEGRQVVLVAETPLGSGNSLYARYGDWLGWLCLVGAFGFALAISIGIKRRDKPPG